MEWQRPALDVSTLSSIWKTTFLVTNTIDHDGCVESTQSRRQHVGDRMTDDCDDRVYQRLRQQRIGACQETLKQQCSSVAFGFAFRLAIHLICIGLQTMSKDLFLNFSSVWLMKIICHFDQFDAHRYNKLTHIGIRRLVVILAITWPTCI